jgi:hypothetical protein
MVRLFVTALLCFPLVVSSGCAQPGPDDNIVKRDFAGTGPDLTGADLSGEDLTGTLADMGSADMVRKQWVDYSVTVGTFTNMQGQVKPYRLWTVWSNGAGLVYTVGDNGYQFKTTTGTTFTADTSTKPAANTDLTPLAGQTMAPPAGPLYTGGLNGAIWAFTGDLAAGGAWTAETSGSASAFVLGMTVFSDGAAFAVGTNNYASKRNAGAPPQTWVALTGIDKPAYNLWGIKTATGYVLYAVGYDSDSANGGANKKGKIWKSTGGAFTAQTSGSDQALYGVWGSSENDVYVCGDNGQILHTTNGGTSWTKEAGPGFAGTSPTAVPLEAMTGVNANEIYIVGDNGVVLHKYGGPSSPWEREMLANPNDNRNMLGVWANASEVWVVGEAGAILKK